MIKAIIFDFDGVIANSEPVHLKAFKKTLLEEDIHLSTEEYYSEYLAYDDRTFFEKVFENKGKKIDGSDVKKLVKKKSMITAEMFDNNLEFFPGVSEFIRDAAKHFKLAIGSGALRSEIVILLEKFDLFSEFENITSADDVSRSKPDPEVFIKALDSLNKTISSEFIDSSECIVIEDSIYGIRAAKAAGMGCIAITNSYIRDKLHEADYIVDSIEELTVDKLKKFF